MALIPPDAGIRMRLQNELPAQPQPIAPLPEIPGDLPELTLGQAFTARIQEALPQNTYKALVAGKFVTLQLPEGAKAGDTLELVVVDRTPRAVVATLAGQAGVAAAAGETYPHATLSPAARLIGELLLPQGEAPEPTPLNRGQPLLSGPPLRGSDLAPVLAKAIAESGVFYEAHQAQWVAGQRPLEQLLLEPQAQVPVDAAAQRGNQAATSGEASLPALRHAPQNSLIQSLFGGERAADSGQAASQNTSLAHVVPEALRPIVQQQLDAAATLRLVWHGEAWPNQPMEWEIVREDERGAAPEEAEERASWRTHLRLETPRLGRVDAALQLTRAGIQLTIVAPDRAAAADLQQAAPQLAAALDAAGLSLLSFAVRHEPAAG